MVHRIAKLYLYAVVGVSISRDAVVLIISKTDSVHVWPTQSTWSERATQSASVGFASMDDLADKRWNEVLADLAEGRTSVLDIIRTGQLHFESLGTL